MGFNSTVLILNDRLEEIKRNPQQFAENLYTAIGRTIIDLPQEFSPGQSEVIDCQHADVVSIIAVGGNCASILGRYGNGGHHHQEESKIQLLKWLADDYGYRLVRKSKKKK